MKVESYDLKFIRKRVFMKVFNEIRKPNTNVPEDIYKKENKQKDVCLPLLVVIWQSVTYPPFSARG